MAMNKYKECVIINIPGSEIIPKCRIGGPDQIKDSDVTGYYTNDNAAKYREIEDFFDGFHLDFYINHEKCREYANDIKRYVYKYKNIFVNKMDSFNRLATLFSTNDIKIHKMFFGGSTGRYLKFDNDEEISKTFKEFLYDGVTDLVIEKNNDRFFVYPQLNRTFYKKLSIDIDQLDADDNVQNEDDDNSQTSIFERKERENCYNSLNTIIYGAPGTGKTYSTVDYALAFLSNVKPDLSIKTKEQRKEEMERFNSFAKNGRISFVTFHQSYGYEDFIQGLRPYTSENGVLLFKNEDGAFKKIADKAMNDPDDPYVMIIDEINRGNISRIFGELITLIEEDKRFGELNALTATLPSGESFSVPNNLYILGTMNSADKSISIIDTALRRRFRFIEMSPDSSLVKDLTLKKIMEDINSYLKDQLNNTTDLLIGHSYFMNKTKADLSDILNDSIIPLLYEYFYGVEGKVEKALDCLKDTDVEIDKNASGRIKVKDK